MGRQQGGVIIQVFRKLQLKRPPGCIVLRQNRLSDFSLQRRKIFTYLFSLFQQPRVIRPIVEGARLPSEERAVFALRLEARTSVLRKHLSCKQIGLTTVHAWEFTKRTATKHIN